MRLPEIQIKEAILHTDTEIRQRATKYFAKSFSCDTSVMPLVIQAVERFGKQDDAYHLIGLSRGLPQTEATIDWIIDELSDEQSDQHENYVYNLSIVLVTADPALLLPKESAILESQHFLPGLHTSFSERLEMLCWDEATCWRALETFCEDGKDKQYTNEVDLSHADRIVEALARYGDDCNEKVLAILQQKVEDFKDNPMTWMEPLAARLAGEARLDSSVPFLISKLIEDGGDLLNGACAESLAKIGTSEMLEAVAEAYSNSSRNFRLYAIKPLECIHSDVSVAKCLHLLRQEQDVDRRIDLAYALLSHFAEEGVEEVRKILLAGELGFESRGLRNLLVKNCTISGARFPEYDTWRTAEKTEKQEHRKRIQELADDPAGLMLYGLEQMTGKSPAVGHTDNSASPPKPHLDLPLTSDRKQRVGRNAPCPCGSGKKFKKCCMTSKSN